jgi:hypothetical protein
MFTTYSSKARLTLPELGRFHRDYLEFMAHFDAVLPGRIHRVMYEDLVTDPEAEIRRLLDYLGLPFDPACLRFHETKRTVLTPSSEQGAPAPDRDAISHWRNYEPWLGPLFEGWRTVRRADPALGRRPAQVVRHRGIRRLRRSEALEQRAEPRLVVPPAAPRHPH